MIIWFTGNSGAGKTTLAQAIQKRCPETIILDGDEMRASISLGAGFSKEAREEHNLRVARLAKVLDQQGHIILVSVIAPFQDARDKITEICDPTWVYVKRNLSFDVEKPYQEPINAFTVDVNHFHDRVDEEADLVLGKIIQKVASSKN